MSMAKGDIHTVPSGDRWANRAAGNQRASGLYDTQRDAEQAGRSMAIDRGVEHYIHRPDGRIRDRNTYPRSRDPRDSKG